MANKLDKWLTANNVKRGAFAKAIGVSPSYVTLLCSDNPGWPSREVIVKITAFTSGAITADDFLPPAGHPPASAGAEAAE